MHVVLPCEPDATVHLEAVTGHLRTVLVDVALRHARQLLSIHVGVDRTGGRHCERLRRLHAEPHVGEPMLERLERADRAAECLAVFHVGERQVEQGVDRADTFATLQGRRDPSAAA